MKWPYGPSRPTRPCCWCWLFSPSGCWLSSLTSWKETPSSGRAAEAGAGEAVAEGGGTSNCREKPDASALHHQVLDRSVGRRYQRRPEGGRGMPMASSEGLGASEHIRGVARGQGSCRCSEAGRGLSRYLINSEIAAAANTKPRRGGIRDHAPRCLPDRRANTCSHDPASRTIAAVVSQLCHSLTRSTLSPLPSAGPLQSSRSTSISLPMPTRG